MSDQPMYKVCACSTQKCTYRPYVAGHTHRGIIYCHKICFTFTLGIWRPLLILGVRRGFGVEMEKEVAGREVRKRGHTEEKGNRFDPDSQLPTLWTPELSSVLPGRSRDQNFQKPEVQGSKCLTHSIFRRHQQVSLSPWRITLRVTSVSLSEGYVSILYGEETNLFCHMLQEYWTLWSDSCVSHTKGGGTEPTFFTKKEQIMWIERVFHSYKWWW